MSLISVERSYETFFTVKLKNKKEGTKKQYKYALSEFDKFCISRFNKPFESIIQEFRNAKPEEIIDTLQEYINSSEMGTINKKGRVIQINNYLYYRGIKIDPRDMKDLEYEEGLAEDREPLTDEEIRKIMDNAKPKQKALYATLYSSGMRIGECCHLTKADFDFSQGRIKINIKPEYTKKNASGRIVYISKEAENYLMPILDEIGKKDLVFTSGGSPSLSINNFQMQFRRLVDKIGLGERYGSGTRKKTLHAMRAFFFTKATQVHGLAYAHKMTGHKGYLEQYNRYTEAQKLQMYMKLESHLTVYGQKIDLNDPEKFRLEVLNVISSMKTEEFLEIKRKLGLKED